MGLKACVAVQEASTVNRQQKKYGLDKSQFLKKNYIVHVFVTIDTDKKSIYKW